jgi:hypothetical protein
MCLSVGLEGRKGSDLVECRVVPIMKETDSQKERY